MWKTSKRISKKSKMKIPKKHIIEKDKPNKQF